MPGSLTYAAPPLCALCTVCLYLKIRLVVIIVFLPPGGSRTSSIYDIDKTLTLSPCKVGDSVSANNYLFIQQTQSNISINFGFTLPVT